MMVVVGMVVLIRGHGCHGHVVVHHVDVWPMAVLFSIGIRIRIRFSVAVVVAIAVLLDLVILVDIARIVNMVLSIGISVRRGGGGAMDGLVQVRVLVGGAETLG